MTSGYNADDTTGMVGDTTLKMDTQSQSKLFQLPQELRDRVYSYLFFSTRLSWGSRRTSIGLFTGVKPAAHSVAILQTCRRTNQEVGDQWMSQVLFAFEEPRTMIDKLNGWPTKVAHNMRHLRVICDSALVLGEENQELCRQLTSLLRQLPSLRLDTMTFIVVLEQLESHGALHQLIMESCGWKRLYYIAENIDMISGQILTDTASPDKNESIISRYTKYWQRIIENRDGGVSRPTITIYRPTSGHCGGPARNSNVRERLDQRVLKEESKYFYEGVYEGTWEPDEGGREVMIVVNRGYGVDYEKR